MGNNNSNILPPECSTNSNVTVQREGMMEKRGDFNTNYKRRWFVLYTNGMMTYRVKPGDSKLRGNVSFCAIKKLERKTAVTFEVTTAQKVWYFRCQNATDCDDWIQSIQTAAAPPTTTLTSNTLNNTDSAMKSTDSTSLISYIDSGLSDFYYKKGLGLRYVNGDGIGLFAAFCTNNGFDEETVIDELDPQNKTECQIIEFDPEFPFDGTERDRNNYIFDLLFSLYQQHGDEQAAVQSNEDTAIKAPKDDFNDDSKESVIPTIDLRPFKLQSTKCGGSGKDVISRCAHLQRLFAARRYFEKWEARSGPESAKQQFADFVSASYPQFTEDYIHFVKAHDVDLEEMANLKGRGHRVVRRCDIGNCSTLRREHGRRRRVKRKGQRESPHARYCSSVIDRVHVITTHLFEMGLRLEKEESVEVDEDEKKEDGIGGEDKVWKTRFATLARRRRQFAAAAPDIADDDGAEQQKFTITGGVLLCPFHSEFTLKRFFESEFQKHSEHQLVIALNAVFTLNL